MISRILSITVFLFFASISMIAQCAMGSEPSCQCGTAPVLCVNTQLDGYTYSMSTFLHPGDGPESMCSGSEGNNTASHNPTWIAFVAWCTDLTLEVAYDNCVANQSICDDLGIQAAVYSDCTLDPNSAIDCNADNAKCIDDSFRTLTMTGLTNGHMYYLLVDGCCGSACDIEITVIGTCGDGDIPAWTQSIQGSEDVYATGVSRAYSVDAVTNGSEYHWFIDGVEVTSGVGMTTFNRVWSTVGEYEVCVDVSNSCNLVTDMPMSLCKTVLVRPLPSVDIELAYTGFSAPVDIANAGDDRLFIVEQAGYIRIIENGITLSTPFLDIDSRVTSGGERGLLGLAFHPDYLTNGYFFVNYFNNTNSTIVARYKVSDTDANVADVNSEAVLMTIAQPFSNHNAGDLNFSPNDGYLYVAMGDGGSGGDPYCNAQDSMSLLGKMLRVDVDQNVNNSPYYGIPNDNPFVNVNGALDEIFQLGLRNPWRFVFNDETGDLWIADVGQNVKEEVNFLAQGGMGGENFGWKVMEGTNCYDPDPIDTDCPVGTYSCNDDAYTDPVFEYGHDANGGYSITGGYVLGGCRYPYIDDLYICADFVSANSWLVASNGFTVDVVGAPSSISTYGVGNDGQVYLSTLNGNIYRVNDGNIARVIYITMADSPVSGHYEALDSIIVSDNVTIAENQTITLSAPTVRVAESVFVPETSELIIDILECEDNF